MGTALAGDSSGLSPALLQLGSNPLRDLPKGNSEKNEGYSNLPLGQGKTSALGIFSFLKVLLWGIFGCRLLTVLSASDKTNTLLTHLPLLPAFFSLPKCGFGHFCWAWAPPREVLELPWPLLLLRVWLLGLCHC